MSDNFGTNPEKMLVWDTIDKINSLDEQSDYVKKAIQPLLTWNFVKDIYILNKNFDETFLQEQYKENPNFLKEYVFKNLEVVDLFDHLSVNGSFSGDEKPVVEIFKSLGIEGCIHSDRVDIYDDEYLKELNIIHKNFMSGEYNWKNVSELPGMDEFLGDYLETRLNNYDNSTSYFIIGQPINSDSDKLSIMFFQNIEAVEDHNPIFLVDANLDYESAKNIVEETTVHIGSLQDYKLSDIKEYVIQQLPEQAKIIQTSDRQLETAQKTGYVQGVCESVLAFNNDENRKIMTEATMTFLSKKLLSEMDVTKEMAQKFANPDTYKALEKCVFAQNQEQQLEQTQSQGFRR